MKALTLYQPWASLIADGIKLIETRPRSLSYRGTLAIHAGQKVDREACLQFGYDPDTIQRGAVVAIVHMADCVQFPHPMVEPDPYGNFAPGRYGYLLELLEKLETPIPARGYQCLWDWKEPRCQQCGGPVESAVAVDGYSTAEILWCPKCRKAAPTK